jgi:1,4-alpha-glucan branching enzyme
MLAIYQKMCDTIKKFLKVEKIMKTKTTKKCAATKVAKKCAAKPAAAKCSKKTEKKDVVFTVHAERGKTVYLAGEFNDWNPTGKKMTYKAKNGIYCATVKLVPGVYQYKFVIDGAWCADPENADSVANDQGTFNSVITVK